MLLMLLQACVLQGASIRPAVQSNRAASDSPSSSSWDEGDSHHSRGFEETDTSSDDTRDSSSSHNDSDSDTGSGSDGGAYQQFTRNKHTVSRGQCRKKVTVRSGKAVASPPPPPPPPPAAAAGTSSLTSGPGAANTPHRAHALPSPQCIPPHLVWCQRLFTLHKGIKLPGSLCTDISTECGTTASTGYQCSCLLWCIQPNGVRRNMCSASSLACHPSNLVLPQQHRAHPQQQQQQQQQQLQGQP